MKKTLKEALESRNLPKAREILIEIISTRSDSTSTLEDVAVTISETPDLFEPDDGKFYAASAADMTEALIETLHHDLSSNFSLPKFQLFTEVQEKKHNDPKYYKERVTERVETDKFADGTMTITEEIDGKRIAVASVSETPNQPAGGATANAASGVPNASFGNAVNIREDRHEAYEQLKFGGSSTNAGRTAHANDTYDDRQDEKNPLKTSGYIIMIIGLIAAVVSLCVSLHFLLGIGIGLFMIGTAIVYFVISNRRFTPTANPAP